MWLSLLLAASPMGEDRLSLPPEELAGVEDLVRDLRGQDDADALYAARELKAQARTHQKTVARGRPGSLRVQEARQQLSLIEERAVGPCLDRLNDPRVAAPCAGLLAELGLTETLPALNRAAEDEELPRRARRAAERAIRRLEQA